MAWVVGRFLAAVAEWKSYGNVAAAHSLPDIEDCRVACYKFCQYYHHSRNDSKPACPLCATQYVIELFHLQALMHNSLFINKCMLHYYPRHVSSINMPIFRRTNCIHTASGIVVLCKRLLSTSVLCSRLQRATIPDAV